MRTDGWEHIDLFSGGNAFRLGFESSGFKIINHHYSEIDKHAIATTEYNFPNSRYLGTVEHVSGVEFKGKRCFITFGWPCQDNSIAGKRAGHAPGTRSSLLSHSVRIIAEAQPWFFVAENVEGLRTVNKGVDIIEAIELLTFLNESLPQYDVEMQLLNTRWFLPQNRERLYFVGHLRDGSRKQVFPIGEDFAGAYEGNCKTSAVRCITAGGNSGGLHSNMTLLRWQNKKDGVVESDISQCLRATPQQGIDRLWVRESWNYSDSLEEPYLYKQKEMEELQPEYFESMKWKPSIHMPKEACRILLEITDIRVELLHDISESDAVAEGIQLLDGKLDDSPVFRNYNQEEPDVKYGYGYPSNSFRSLWESINGKEGWYMNPWVWVVEFKKVDQSN